VKLWIPQRGPHNDPILARTPPELDTLTNHYPPKRRAPKFVVHTQWQRDGTFKSCIERQLPQYFQYRHRVVKNFVTWKRRENNGWPGAGAGEEEGGGEYELLLTAAKLCSAKKLWMVMTD